MLHLAGHRDSSTVRQAAGFLAADPSPPDRFLLGAFAASQHSWAEVERQIQALESGAREAASRPDSIGAADRRAYAQGLRGYAALQRGDRAAALKELEEAVPNIPFNAISEILRYELGRLFLDAGSLRAAERYLRSLESHTHDAWSAWTSTLAEFYLGQVYEALGDIEESKLHYARFVRWWERCDPELRPLWEKGREALTRLTRERSN